jgi:hypothetical protein
MVRYGPENIRAVMRANRTIVYVKIVVDKMSIVVYTYIRKREVSYGI